MNEPFWDFRFYETFTKPYIHILGTLQTHPTLENPIWTRGFGSPKIWRG
jgi:hypothetical protein